MISPETEKKKIEIEVKMQAKKFQFFLFDSWVASLS